MISGCGRRVAGLHLALHCAALSAEKQQSGKDRMEGFAREVQFFALNTYMLPWGYS